MILAAGIGTRMAPLSDRRAKPVLPVLDEPLVARLVRELAGQGVEHIVVNAHAYPEQVADAVANAPVSVEISVERELRGSGGGILQARAFLEDSDPFLVVNSDMCVDLDLASLLEAHRRQRALATLALRDESRKHDFGTIGYADTGLVSRITNLVDRGSENGSGLFTGVQLIEPEVLARMPTLPSFGILTDVYVPLLRAGQPIGSWLQPTDTIWWPVGTPSELLDTNLEALRLAVRAPGAPVDGVIAAADADIQGEVRGPAWIGRGACVERGAHAGPGVVIGAGARLAEGASAAESLLLPGATPKALTLERAVAHDQEVWRDG